MVPDTIKAMSNFIVSFWGHSNGLSAEKFSFEFTVPMLTKVRTLATLPSKSI